MLADRFTTNFQPVNTDVIMPVDLMQTYPLYNLVNKDKLAGQKFVIFLKVL